jgi:hypothetical protein
VSTPACTPLIIPKKTLRKHLWQSSDNLQLFSDKSYNENMWTRKFDTLNKALKIFILFFVYFQENVNVKLVSLMFAHYSPNTHGRSSFITPPGNNED